jgi:hypothetical protein
MGCKEEYKEAFIEAIKMNGDRVIPQLDLVADGRYRQQGSLCILVW